MKLLAPLPLRWPTWARLAVVTAAVVGATACIIGPKQDDPEALTTSDATDTGTAVPAPDTGNKMVDDVATIAPMTETGAGGDATAPADTTAPSADVGCTSDAGDAGETGCSDDDGGRDAVSSD